MGSSVAFHVQEIIDALVGGMNSVQESPSGQSIGSSLLLAMLLSFSQLSCLNVKPIAQGHPLALRKHSPENRPSIKQWLDHTRAPLCGFASFSDVVSIMFFVTQMMGAANRSCKCAFPLTVSEHR